MTAAAALNCGVGSAGPGGRIGPKVVRSTRKSEETASMATVTATTMDKLESILGDQAKDLLEHSCKTVSKDLLHLPGPDFVSRIWSGSDRPTQVLRSLEAIYSHGRLGGTGYVSI